MNERFFMLNGKLIATKETGLGQLIKPILMGEKRFCPILEQAVGIVMRRWFVDNEDVMYSEEGISKSPHIEKRYGLVAGEFVLNTNYFNSEVADFYGPEDIRKLSGYEEELQTNVNVREVYIVWENKMPKGFFLNFADAVKLLEETLNVEISLLEEVVS